MLSQINEFVNGVRRRNPAARTWRDYRNDLQQFAASVDNPSTFFRPITLPPSFPAPHPLHLLLNTLPQSCSYYPILT
jgi:hypothetical protein